MTIQGSAWALALCLASGSALGAETQASVPPVETAVVTVTAGTSVGAVLMENVNSGFNSVGENVLLNTTEDLAVNGRVAIAKGAQIKAQIGSLGQRGMMGKGGDLSFTPVSVQAVDGQWVPLDKDQMGARGAGASVGAIIGIGLFASGKAAFVLRGTTYDVSIRRDTAIDTSKETPGPTLQAADIDASSAIAELKRINFAAGKVGEDIVFTISLPPDIAALAGNSPDSVQIVKMAEEVLREPISAINVTRGVKAKNLLIATFGWWSVIRHAQQGVTSVVLHSKLSDGRVARAQQEMSTEWKLK